MKLLGNKFQPLCRCCEERLSSHDCPPDPDLGLVCIPCGSWLYRVEQLLKGIDGYGQCQRVGPDSGKGAFS